MAGRETLDSSEYVVQYRRVGTKTWHDTHGRSFKNGPKELQVLKELAESCLDLAEWDGRSRDYKIKADYQVRVVFREVIERVSIISPAKKNFSGGIKWCV